MHTLDVLGLQANDTQVSRKNTPVTKNQDNSFQRQLDKEVSHTRSREPSNSERQDQLSREPQARRNSTVQGRSDVNDASQNESSSGSTSALTNQDSIVSRGRKLVEGGSEGLRVASTFSEGLELSPEGDSGSVSGSAFPILNVHIEQNGRPNEHYFQQTQPLETAEGELLVSALDLEPILVNPVVQENALPEQKMTPLTTGRELTRPITLASDFLNSGIANETKPVGIKYVEPAVSSITSSELNNKATSSVLINEQAIRLPNSNLASVAATNSGGEVSPAFSERFSELASLSSSTVSQGSALQEKTGLVSTPVESAARFSVNVQFGRADWNNGVAAKVAQMAAQNLNFAEIQLDPPELGPLQVRVQINNDQASVSFAAHSSQVRDALEQGNQRLRELFESEGLNLVDVDVSDQQQQNQDELDSDQSEETKLSAVGEVESDEQEERELVSADIKMGVDDFV